jgi:hypothetical protein
MAAPERQLHQKGRETLATAAKRSVSKFVPESESVRMLPEFNPAHHVKFSRRSASA